MQQFQHSDISCNCKGKFCPVCSQWKCYLAFYKHPRGLLGLGSRCKECCKQAAREQRRERKEGKQTAIEIPAFEHMAEACSCDGRFCHTCNQWKCHLAFSKDRKGAKGLSATCKVCIRSYQQAHLDHINMRRRENRRENADHYNAYNREFHKRNPEVKKERDRQYRQKNTAYMQTYNKMYREKRKANEIALAKERERQRKYAKLHPEKNAQYFNNRRARIQQAEGSFTSREWKILCKRYNYTCLCCKRREPEIKLTVDHIIPLCQGGPNSIDNIQPLCQSCNSTKHRKIVDYRLNWQNNGT